MSGDGTVSVVTIGAEASTNLVSTPVGHPDLIVEVITPLMAILARAGTVFFNTLVGGLGVTTTGAIPWMTWKVAGVIAASAAAVNIIQSLVTIFSNLEKRFPLLRA